MKTWIGMVCLSVLASLVTVFVILLLVHILGFPFLMKYSPISELFTLTGVGNTKVSDDPFLKYSVEELVREGVIISIKDIWGFQSQFYQAIISFLIAINGVLAVFAFVFIKNTSHDKAIEAAKEHARNYMAGTEFSSMVDNVAMRHAQDKLNQAQDDYTSSTKELYQLLDAQVYYTNSLEILEADFRELKRHIKIVSERVSWIDRVDDDGSNLEISKDGV